MENKRLVACISSGCLDFVPEETEGLDIETLRLHVYFKGNEYLEGDTLDPVKYYQELEELKDAKNNLPKTSMPSSGEIMALFDSAIERGYTEVLVFTISTGLSGTFSAVSQIGKQYEGRLNVVVFDTKTNSYNEGYYALLAARMVKEGKSTEEILKECNWLREHQEFFGVDGKLDYLIYNGRLKGGKALIAKMLSICPVVGFQKNGELTSWETIRTPKKAITRCCEILKEKIGDRAPEDYLLWHCYTGPKYIPVIEEAEKAFGIKTNHKPVMMSASSGSHNGPWFIGYGLIFLRRDDEPLE